MYIYNIMELYNKAIELAKEYHAGQLDKAGKDYFENHIKVVSDMVLYHENNLYAATVALLHDILEDTHISEDHLRQIFPKYIVDAVCVLTKQKHEPYWIYIERVKKNKLAKIVKKYDLANNMDMSRLDIISDKDLEREIKYAKAYAQLMKI